MNNVYLKRYAYPHQLINTPPTQDLGLIITIPAFCETELVRSLASLAACSLPRCSVEVIVVINEASQAGKEVKETNKQSYEDALHWSENRGNDQITFHLLYIKNLPPKHAGVGLARKIAMDEAVRRYEAIGKPDGVIVCFDADSICDTNYLVALERHFITYPGSPGCSIHFEHPLEGGLPKVCYDAIVDYELHLRYYVNGLRYSGFPFAFQTIGSSMAVRSNAYQKQGGMNRRKAGEDFYFLQRIMPLGKFTELNSTRVIPSPRTSDRVPFGTGKAVHDWIQNGQLTTYHPTVFAELKTFLSDVYTLYRLPSSHYPDWLNKQTESIKAFLNKIHFHEHLDRLNNQSSTPAGFHKHFFQWFDGFQVLKYVHFTRDYYYQNMDIKAAAQVLLRELQMNSHDQDEKQLLITFRELDRSGKLAPNDNPGHH
ncbi:glycosyltransferase family 2 protein [Fulvivirga sp. M361]|uniref:glycosyltransferase n=1 Tax=Fulvivirga sp. M361 TaxID=2594266 RepID=UPI00117A9A7F|nr:glycosyltransferase family 2 protein [Fulvivirga sp. M361]TRX60703.1 glycosyltransferase family 2 protein [Fulvivirga sp. M361]